MNWTYKGKNIYSHEDLHLECTDFVYELVFSDNTRYLGKKTVRSESILPAQKKGIREGAERVFRHILRDDNGKIITSKAGRKQARKEGKKAIKEPFDRLVTDKPFTKYTGSSEENEGKTLVAKAILFQTSDKKTASYIEVAMLFENNVLFNTEFNNQNISGVWFDDSLKGLITC